MMPRRFTVAAALSLLVCLWLFLTPRFADAHRFWLASPFGELGPFEKSSESYVMGLMLTFAAPPLLWALIALSRQSDAALRRKRSALGQCLACGYDLRGSKGRCPECGTPISANPARTPARCRSR